MAKISTPEYITNDKGKNIPVKTVLKATKQWGIFSLYDGTFAIKYNDGKTPLCMHAETNGTINTQSLTGNLLIAAKYWNKNFANS